jgi:anthranilate synthase component 2
VGALKTGCILPKVAALANVTLIDNYDSFTWNLYHELGTLGAKVTVVRNDACSAEDVVAGAPDAIVLSPGPGTPRGAGICLDILRRVRGTTPIFGVCLGHQAIGDAYGAAIVRAALPMHGKVSTIEHEGQAVFRGINGAFKATRYHSLVVDEASLPPALAVTARSDDGLVMGLSHRSHPVHGVQFHPESIASEQGRTILRNFLALADDFQAGRA